MAGLPAARMSGDSEFHTAGPECEKARSPNLVRSCAVMYSTCCWNPMQASTCCCAAGRTYDVFEIRRASVSVYSVHDRASRYFVPDQCLPL